MIKLPFSNNKINKKIVEVIDILNMIEEIIKTQETDFLQSIFDSKEDIITELNTHIQKLEKEDFSKIEDLILLFSPTSDLQEISINSGWGEQFLNIAERFDRVIKDLIEEFNLKLFVNT